MKKTIYLSLVLLLVGVAVSVQAAVKPAAKSVARPVVKSKCANIIGQKCIDCVKKPTDANYKKETCCKTDFESCCASQNGLVTKTDLTPKHTFRLSCNAKSSDAGKACGEDGECTYGCDLQASIRKCRLQKSNLVKGVQSNKYKCPSPKMGKCNDKPRVGATVPEYTMDGDLTVQSVKVK